MTLGRFVFVVRIWFEHSESPVDGRQTPMVRGSVEQIDQEYVHYFTSLDEAIVHIEEAITPGASARGDPSRDAPPPDQEK